MSSEELIKIQGGLGKPYLFGLVAGVITFLIGLFDGIIRPFSCNE